MKRCVAVLTSMLCAVGVANADRVVLESGEAVAGKVQGDHLEIATPNGRLSVPYSSIKQLSAGGDGSFKIELVDGTALDGTIAIDKVSVHQALYDRVIPIHDIRAIQWDPPKITLPAGTVIPVELIRALSSKSTEAGAAVEYCVTRPVVVDGKTLVASHAAAWGQVLGVSGGHNVGGGGKLVLRVDGVVAADGGELPLQGTHEVEGGFNGGAVVALGVLGLLTEGNPAEAGNGIQFDGQTAHDADVALLPHPVSEPRAAIQRDCDDYYSLQAGDFIPVEKLRHGRTFAPVPQPLRISLPLLQVVRSTQHFSQGIAAGSLKMEDLSIPTVNLEISPRRRGGADLTITTTIYVRPSQDRLVNLDYQLMAGDQAVRSVKQSGIKAAESRTREARTTLELTAAELAALAAAPDPRLRITMTAIED